MLADIGLDPTFHEIDKSGLVTGVSTVFSGTTANSRAANCSLTSARCVDAGSKSANERFTPLAARDPRRRLGALKSGAPSYILSSAKNVGHMTVLRSFTRYTNYREALLDWNDF